MTGASRGWWAVLADIASLVGRNGPHDSRTTDISLANLASLAACRMDPTEFFFSWCDRVTQDYVGT